MIGGSLRPPPRPEGKRRQRDITVSFDEASRREFVLGFRKRRQMRQKLAQQEQASSEKEARRIQRAKQREETQQKLEEATRVPTDDVILEPALRKSVPKRSRYEDAFTRSTFGEGEVVVETVAGLPGLDRFDLDGGDDSDDDDHDGDDDDHHAREDRATSVEKRSRSKRGRRR